MLKSPLPLFDAVELIKKRKPPHSLTETEKKDFFIAVNFLYSYRGSMGTFNSYRREIERFLHWAWEVAQLSLAKINAEDIESFAYFCQSPPLSWIGTVKVPRFFEGEMGRQPNPAWRPFIASLSKRATRRGEKPNARNFELSAGALKELFAILNTFYNYLLQEAYVVKNPVALVRQKSKFIRKQQRAAPVRRLSEIQWKSILQIVHGLAKETPEKHERTLFILSALYALYLRISELAASPRWAPLMNHFQRDSHGNWWFITLGKGNKERQIAVSNAMLSALKRWRTFLGLSALPSPSDNTPLLPRIRGKGAVTNISHIRKIVQLCFDRTAQKLLTDGLTEEAEVLQEATVHWLRHTGISEDVKHRPREHVRDDAGHSSSAITDKYIDIELNERHRSAEKKPIF